MSFHSHRAVAVNFDDSDPDVVDSDIDVENPTDADVMKLIDRLMRFRTGDAPILRAFEVFARVESREVLEYVAIILNEEVDSNDMNRQLVERGLQVFEAHAHKADLMLLKEFREKVSRLSRDPKQEKAKPFFRTVLESVTRLELSANGRPGIARSIHQSLVPAKRSNLSDLLKTEQEGSPGENLHFFVKYYFTENLRAARVAGQDLKIYARDEIADRIIDVISRRKDRLPMLVGDLGVGMDKVIYRLVQKIADKEYPKTDTHEDIFSDAEVLVIDTDKIMNHNSDLQKNESPVGIRDLQRWANMVQQRFRRRIILVVPDFNEMVVQQTARGEVVNIGTLEAPIVISSGLEVARKSNLGSEAGLGFVPMIFTLPSHGYKGSFSDNLNKLYRGKYEILNVPELKDPDIISILQDQWLMPFSARYGVKIDKEALELSVRNAQRIFPDDSRINASIKVLQDVVISTLRADSKAAGARAETVRVSRKSVSEFIGKRLGVPVDPSDAVAIQKYKQDLKEALNSEVIGQTRMVSDTVDVFVSLFQDPRRPVRSAMMMGGTGVGKTLLAKKLAARAFRNEGAVLELQGSAIQEKAQLWTYFGAGNGYISSENTKGIICDWLDDPARGKFGGVIVLDEAEKACSDFHTRWMEFLDTGTIICGDGKPRFARNHLVLFTSNRGANIMFPSSISNWSNAETEKRLSTLDSEELKKYFLSKTSATDEKRLPTEILQRIDLFTPGAPMNRENAISILKGSARNLEQSAKQQDGVDLEIEDSLISHFVDSRDYRAIGIRPIQREFEAFIVNYKAEILYQLQTGSGNGKRVKLAAIKEPTGMRISVLRQNAEMDMRPGSVSKMPESEIQDPLNDPRFMELVNRLNTELESEVFGQEDTLRSIGSAVISHLSDPGQSKRPLSVLMVGTTGSGKTEIGKALAQARYGSKDRASVISLGEVVTDYDFIKIVGAQGSEMGLFEQALISNPDGGVIVMDEFSNMGGPNLQQKTALLKRFYEMLEEGTWTSPVTNKTYQLRKFTFLWTGNDGEKLFQGETADDTRLATWKEYRSKDKLHKLLLESGIPEAFLGRMADIIFMKPLVQSVMVQIVKKFMNPLIERFESQGIKIEVDDDFAAQTAFSFFMNHRGARSIRDVIEIRIRGQLASAIIKTKAKYPDLTGLVFKVSMKDSMIRTRAYSLDRDGERKVLSEVSVSRGEETIGKFTEDFTDYARKEYRYRAKDAAVTAFHEAGHAIVNDPLATGQKTAAITIIGGEMASGLRYLGYARYEEELKALGKASTREVFISRIARAMAGQMAQILMGYGPDAGWNNDLLQMRTLTTRYALEIGMVPGLESAILGEDGKVHLENLSDSQKRKVFKAVDRMFDDAAEMARDSLQKNWSLVRAVVKDLMTKGYITGERLEELRKQEANSEEPWHIGWNFEKNREQMKRGETPSFAEKTARFKNSCQSFLSKRVLGQY